MPSSPVKGSSLCSQLVFITHEHRAVPRERRQVAALSILQSDVGWPLSLGRGKRGGEGVREGGPFGGWSRGREAWPSHLKLSLGVEVCGPPRAPAPCICVGGALSWPRGHACVGLRCVNCYGCGPGFLAQPLSVEQGPRLAVFQVPIQGMAVWWMHADIAGSETADLSLRPFH